LGENRSTCGFVLTGGPQLAHKACFLELCEGAGDLAGGIISDTSGLILRAVLSTELRFFRRRFLFEATAQFESRFHCFYPGPENNQRKPNISAAGYNLEECSQCRAKCNGRSEQKDQRGYPTSTPAQPRGENHVDCDSYNRVADVNSGVRILGRHPNTNDTLQRSYGKEAGRGVPDHL
jgi:hypothetical protein